MSFEDETGRRRKSETSPQSEEPAVKGKRKRPNAEVGHALRAAYRQTVEEAIPPEMLDLLGKLG